MNTTETTIPRYAVPAPIHMPDRQWPNQSITHAPAWCSVDLRDGNQALPNPLTPAGKLEYFQMLCRIGFKEIEVGFPSASRDDFTFTRRLIEERLIPDDVWIMVLTPCRAAQIDQTIEAIQGAPRAIVHAYCASSELHRTEVFGLERPQLLDMVRQATERIRDGVADRPDSEIRYEFSPEEFTDTDPEFALEMCHTAFSAWGRGSPAAPVVLNLPATVERRPPNQYADMIEWFGRHFPARDSVRISLHVHNDQGMAVAATELGLMAGADRVEGTLFGHGERTGNVDLVTVACNLAVRNIETGLDFTDLPAIADTVVRLTGMPIYYRAPYSGEYVFTAFSGSHQDAIRKGIQARHETRERFGVQWKVPYLHVDPAQIGRRYERLIRINTQSGKGGAVWVLETEFGLRPPRAMHPEIGAAVQVFSDATAREITPEELYRVFQEAFVLPPGPYELVAYWPRPDEKDPGVVHGELRIRVRGVERHAFADGNGPISAFVEALRRADVDGFRVQDYAEQSVGSGADARAVAYVPLRFADDRILHGVGMDTNIDQAAVKAIVACLNRRDGGVPAA